MANLNDARRIAHTTATEAVSRWGTERDAKKRFRKLKKGEFKKVDTSFRREDFNKSGDPEFNYAAAEKVYNIVAKMDDDSAEMFTYLIACELFDQDVQKNLRTLQSHLDEVIAKRTTRLKTALRQVVRKDLSKESVDHLQALLDLEKISKVQSPYDHGYRFEASEHPRAATSGRFTARIRPPARGTKPLSDDQATAAGIEGTPEGLGRETKAQYQNEYQQIADFLSTYQRNGGDAATDHILLHVQNKRSGETYTVPAKMGSLPDTNAWNPKTQRVVGMEARPQQLTAGGAGFSLATAMGADSHQAYAAGQGLGALDANITPFSEDWTRSGKDDYKNANDRLYRRTRAAGEMTQALSPPGSRMQMAGRLAELVGQHGPEAEKVLGPTARKTAYRYRGTEKTPDANMVAEYTRAINNAKGQSRGTSQRSLQQIVTDRQADQEREPTQQEVSSGRAAIAEWYMNPSNKDAGGVPVIPSKKLYGLQLAAGNTPPSQGVIINDKGQIAVQAVGYGDDHYLPFNLKNLKGLKGGEYIRTRSVGGPTSEDIYTGLLSGARRVTVVSRSGLFTIEFDDTFRGGRRYNDKAMRMTDRYEHLLDAVQSEQVDSNPVPQHVQESIRGEVAREYPGAPVKDQQYYFKQKIEEYKAYDGLDARDNAWIDAQVSSIVNAGPAARSSSSVIGTRFNTGGERSEKDIRSELVASLLSEKEYKYRLNGTGYAAALQALEEQFPYYIKVNSIPKREDVPDAERDKGYIMPRHNRPAEALAGYFDPRIAGEGQVRYKGANAEKKTGKIKASEADYQNVTYAHLSNPESRGEEGPTETLGGGGAAATAASPTGAAAGPAYRQLTEAEQLQVRLLDAQDVNNFDDAVWTALRSITWPPPPAAGWPNPVAGLAAAGDDAAHGNFTALVGSLDGRNQARKLLHEQAATIKAQSPGEYEKAETAALLVDRTTYNPQRAEVLPASPYEFPTLGKVYSKIATPEEINHELTKLTATPYASALTNTKFYQDMDDTELRKELSTLGLLKSTADQIRARQDPSERAAAIGAAGITNVRQGMMLINSGDPNAIAKQQQTLHRIRLLKANSRRTSGPGTPPVTPPPNGGRTPPPAGGTGPVRPGQNVPPLEPLSPELEERRRALMGS